MVRSLGKRGIEVYTIFFSKKSICEVSRYCTGSYFLGDPQKDYLSFGKNFRSHIESFNYDLILPVNDHANEIIMDHRDFLEQHCKVCAPTVESYAFAHDKIKTGQLSEELDIPYPKSEVITNIGQLNVEALDFPLYAKPQFSSQLKNGVLHNYQVRKIKSADNLENFLRDNLGTCNVMLQEGISGYGVGVNIAAEKGEIIAYGITNRLHEPTNGGNSSYRKSIPLSDTLKEYAEKIVSRLKWNGVAMLEFKYDGSNYYLMEINSRIWGSIGLSIYSGVDFPVILFNLYSDKRLTDESVYKPNLYARNLYRDVHWTLTQLAARRVGLVIKEFLVGMIRLITFREKIDEFDRRDIKPFISSLSLVCRRYLQHALRSKTRDIDKNSRKGLIEIKPGTHLLFLCKGNINRSAFAQHYLREKYGINSDSAGTLLRRSRLVSKEAESTAEKYFSLDMSAHRSTSIYDVALDKYDFIVVFDDHNYRFLRESFSTIMDKVVYLIPDEQIDDPYSRDSGYFYEKFSMIASTIDNLIPDRK